MLVEPVAAELLMALASGALGAAGQSAWERLRGLVVRRPDGRSGSANPVVGEGELTAFGGAVGDEERARRLADALALRATQDPAFAQALATWRQEAEAVRDAHVSAGDQHQEISGGTQTHVVFLRDVNGNINIG
ncbi:hypothetical protein ACFVT5_25035 [Streptomyces sp. NPDC058001]|uniref:hypothetical protein n=1 Tax=Streptomyces sp. NPDC058001 TaxID=3346300 RepID=UPI0036E2F44C